jgi:hypothetical protein
MKKTIVILAIFIGSVAAVVAQPRAVGARLTYGIEASYQHYVGEKNFIQADLGLLGFSGLSLTGTYNWIIAQPQWTDEGTWDFYLGVGLGAGGFFFSGYSAGFAGVAGNAGLSYTFNIPLQLAIEERPIIGALFGNWGAVRGVGFFAYYYPALAVRYSF